MTFIPLGIVTDHVTGRSWHLKITEDELTRQAKERTREAYKRAERTANKLSVYEMILREAIKHTPLEGLVLREIDRLTAEVKELQQAVKESNKGE